MVEIPKDISKEVVSVYEKICGPVHNKWGVIELGGFATKMEQNPGLLELVMHVYDRYVPESMSQINFTSILWDSKNPLKSFQELKEISDQYAKCATKRVSLHNFMDALSEYPQLSKNIKQIVDVYEKYVPRNIPFVAFAGTVAERPSLLKEIKGEYSSVNRDLLKVFKDWKKGKKSDDDLRGELGKAVPKNVINNVVQERTDFYTKMICSDDDMLQAAWTFETLNRQQRQDLANKIIATINKHFGIETKLKVRYVNKKIQDPLTFLIDGIADIVFKIINKIDHTNYKARDWGARYEKPRNRIIMLNQKKFSHFLGLLAHEYGHFIDHKYPDLGMLGAQIASYGYNVYSSTDGTEIYRANPTEISSYAIGNAVKSDIEEALRNQTKKKPALYAKSLQTLIDYTKVKLKANKLTGKKEQAKVLEQMLQEYESELEKIKNEQKIIKESKSHDK